MKDIPRFAATLTLVALVSAGTLAWLNEITHPIILEQQAQELKAGLISVLPGADENAIVPVKRDGAIAYYEGFTDRNKTEHIGYAFLCLSQGYSSTIRTLVGIDSSGSILAMTVLFQEETPGLGTRCQEVRPDEAVPWWQAQFSDLSAPDLAVDKDGGPIESITGATITSRAITDGIAQRARDVLDWIRTLNE